MMKRLLYILFLVLGFQAVSNGQRLTNVGTDFWGGFGHTGPMDDPTRWFPGDEPETFFTITTGDQPAHVDITTQGKTLQSFDVPANTVFTTINMPYGLSDKPPSLINTMLWSNREPIGTPNSNSEGIFKNKGIKIHSSVPVVAYEFTAFNGSFAGTMLIPVDCWGHSYKVLSPNQYISEDAASMWFAWIFVVANYDNTAIKIVPTHETRNGLPANQPIYVTLNKGDIYQILASVKDVKLSNDFCGTTVSSVENSDKKCLPIATFVGSSGDIITCGSLDDNPGAYADQMLHQMFPVEAWGRRYLTTPTSYVEEPDAANKPMPFQPNIFRVMVKDPSIKVTRNGVPLTGMTPQNYYEYTSNTPDYIEADGPVQVAQILPSQHTCNYAGLGDPDMTFLSPIEQSIKKVGFLRTEKWDMKFNLLALNIPTAGLSSLTIDGKKNNWNFVMANPNLPGYSVVARKWNTKSSSDGRAPAQCIVESDSAFTAITYGFGSEISYAYNVGTYIDNLSGVPYIKNQYNNKDTANAYTCAKTPVELSVLIRYQPSKILWQLSELKDVLAPAADVLQNAPVSSGVEIVWGIPYYRYKLPGSYVFNKPGTYEVPVFATAPGVESCDNTEQIKYEVLVKDTLQTDFDFPFDDKCADTKLIKFTAKDKFTDASTIMDWQWTFMNGTVASTATGREPAAVTFNAGNNSARLIAVDGSGCIADTTKTIAFGPKPATPDFKIIDVINCENKAITMTENSQATVQSWYWSFGDGKVFDTTLNGQTAKHIYTTSNTYTIKHVVRASASCPSDTATQIITVNASPKINIRYPTGCLPDAGIVTFDNTTTVTGNATVTHSWDFGDAAATPANPNTSTAVSPKHTYVAGDYTIKYTATSSNGCAIDTPLHASFSPHPTFSFEPLAGQCENLTNSVSVAKASVINGLAGTGIYKGPGVTAAGDFTPSIPKAGSYKVWYVFTTTGGCIDSASSIIKVHAQPQTKFIADANVCIDKTVSFTDQSTIDNIKDPGAVIKNWQWNFDDGTPPVTNTNGNPFTKQFNAAKTYNVSLKTTSDFGCESAPFTQAVIVHPLPVASFTLPTVVCFKDATIFTNTSSSPDNATLTYNWNLGDGSTSTDLNPSHIFNAKNNYDITLTATSIFGCVSVPVTATLSISVFKDKPVAAFDVNFDKPCQDEDYYFTDKSLPAANIASWNWNFGDGTSSIDKNPVKKYSVFGDKTVSLSVTDIYGCSSNNGEIATSKIIQVNIKPVINAGPDMAVNEGSSVMLQGKAENANKLVFAWAPASLLSGANTLTPMYNAVHDQLFELTATDIDGVCSATDEVFIKMLRPVKVPNVFSPNGDGINDKWMIANLAEYMYCKVSVFNRYGQLVYSSSGYTNPWDGTMNGAPLAVGTYYYIIDLNNGDPVIKGSITILR